jgi:diguanylate cyclase (GGDEF)-like protein/PAS domain S-box-containing protein
VILATYLKSISDLLPSQSIDLAPKGNTMEDEKRTRQALIAELRALQKKVADLESVPSTQKILKTDARYRTIIENSPISMIFYSPDGRPIRASKNTFKLWGINQKGWGHLQEHYNILEDPQLEARGAMPYIKRAFAGKITSLPVIAYDVRETPGSDQTSTAQDVYWVKSHLYPIKAAANGEIQEVLLIQEEISQQIRIEKELRESEQRFRELADNIREVFWLFDWNEQRVLYVSPAYEKIWGRSVEDLYTCYEDWGESIHPDDAAYAEKSFAQILQTGGGQNREYRIIRPDGTIRWVSDRGFAITDDDGQMAHIAGIAEDITERKKVETALRDSEEKFRTLAEQSPNMIFINKGGQIIYTNNTSKEVLGYTKEEFYSPDFSFLSIIAPEHRDLAKQSFNIHRQGREVQPLEYSLVTKNGDRLEVIVNTRLINFNGDTAILGTVTDITPQKLTEKKLAHFASHDALTELKNRRAFDDGLAVELARAERNEGIFAVFLLDLDNFKLINDQYGHDMGDSVLQHAAERLSSSLRKSDLIARIGGDEFILMLPDVKQAQDILSLAEKILVSFRMPFTINKQDISITASIGVAVYPLDGDDPTTLKKHADTAMYRVKANGKDNYQVYSSVEKTRSVSR